MDKEKYYPRDLSWLSFNERILMEAARTEVPLYERIKFLAIYSSNLYEFYRVRVATQRRLVDLKSKKIDKKLDIPPAELLHRIEQTVNKQLNRYGGIIRESIVPALADQHIHLYFDQAIPDNLHAAIRYYFRTQVLAYLKPVHSTQFSAKKRELENHQMYLVFSFQSISEDKLAWAYVNVPKALPRFYLIPTKSAEQHIVWLEDIIRLNADYLFPNREVTGSYSVVLSRDADLQIEDEYEGNLVEKIKKQLAKRDWGRATRFLFDPNIPSELLAELQKSFELSQRDLVTGGRYHNLNDLFSLPNPKKPALEYQTLAPLRKSSLDTAPRLLDHIEQQDELLMFPYHTYDYVLQFFNEAAAHPEVKEINVTLYRIAKNSQVAEALMSAAQNGKKVRVFVEVKARFDEENNLRWAARMEEADVKIIYSMPNLKVHAKVALVKRKDAEDRTRYYAYLGTGNFNEKTSSIYADLALLTSHVGLCKDVERVFQFLYKGKEVKKIEHLLVAPVSLKPRLIDLIDQEIAWAKQGKRAEILLKLNAIEDREMIDKLYQASQAGVKITLLVRGICCLRPQVSGLSGNITVIRLVDRYLEHARVYQFHNNGEEQMYLASADWMRRNLHHRVEVVFPIYDKAVRERVNQMLAIQLRDNQQACYLDADLENIWKKDGKEVVSAQETIYRWLAQLKQ